MMFETVEVKRNVKCPVCGDLQRRQSSWLRHLLVAIEKPQTEKKVYISVHFCLSRIQYFRLVERNVWRI